MKGGLRISRALRVLAKEIREALRDRNLVIQVVLVPLFLYPLLGFAFFQVFMIMQGMSERETTRVAVGGDAPAEVVAALEESESLEVIEVPGALGGAPDSASFRAYRESAARGEQPVLHAFLAWEDAGGDSGPSATVFFDRSRERSAAARDTMEAVLMGWERGQALAALQGVGLGEAELDVWEVEEENTASAEQRGQELLSMALPMILLLMLAQGTFYSSLDTVVGERERGTLETILTTPLARGEVLLGKFLFVVTSSVVSLVLNLASLTLFFGFLLRLLGGGDDIRVTIAPEALALIVVTAVLTAGLVASVLMMLAVPAKTYREGQASLTLAYLLILIPGFFVTFSREPFGMAQATVPLLNSVALFKSALRGEMPAGPILVTFLVLAVTAGAALAFASRIVAREEIYFSPSLTLRRVLTGLGGKSE